MMKAQKGRKDTWDVPLPGLKEPAVVRRYQHRYSTLWCVKPLLLTDTQRRKAGDLVKKRLLGN